MNRLLRLLAPVGAAAAVALSGLAAPAGAQVTPVLNVNPAIVPAGSATTVAVSGTGFLVPPHAPDKNVFGGVYVLFGWVQPGNTWGPSARNGTNSDGQFGITYSYAGASRGADTRDDGTGHNRFVSFTSGGISGESTDFHMAMDPAFPDNSRGYWSTTITIPGSSYQWTDPATNVTKTVDCLQVQCGIYTIGAHGVASQTNEKFFPVTFSTGGTVVTIPPPAPGVTVAPGGATGGGTPSGSGSNQQPSATVGGTNTTRSTTKGTTKPNATTSTTIAAAVGPTDTAPVETAPPAVEDTTIAPPTSEAPTSTSTTVRRSDGDEINSASGRVLVYEGGDDGVSGWIWGPAVGLPLVGAAGVVVWRRRTPNAV